jgi:hypothetical protein
MMRGFNEVLTLYSNAGSHSVCPWIGRKPVVSQSNEANSGSELRLAEAALIVGRFGAGTLLECFITTTW